jgi:hypothetical protein
MSKRQIIDRIMRLNPSATPEFLAQFGQSDLLAYLKHLSEVEFEQRHRQSHQPAIAVG